MLAGSSGVELICYQSQTITTNEMPQQSTDHTCRFFSGDSWSCGRTGFRLSSSTKQTAINS